MALKTCDIFGGTLPWKAADWTSSDDRVRGGKSESYFDISPEDPVARFYGKLDIKTLGGAGFASQRTTGENRTWNVDGYDGIQLEITKSDSKRYTFNIKNELLPPDPNTGREQSTISYEHDFVAPSPNATGEASTVFIPWDGFKATYRGREDPDAPPVNLTDIKRFNIMMRSFFGDQEGDFSLSIKSITAVRKDSDDKSTLVSEKRGIQFSDLEKGLLDKQAGEIKARMAESSAARRTPSFSRVLYGTAAILLAIWVLYPGTPGMESNWRAPFS
ncbi:Galactose-binding domain-like protein [Macrophomina phaseolina MS6]|uniref:Galactose-binding domain-like protein n=1 Tax=Macrophomina phaseolina (strain MS6) TaxID=1126212 RepID=K2SSB9_MACPH|nr:Galactose-binding domain-like protein [Macrophomina phaseolina MS6]